MVFYYEIYFHARTVPTYSIRARKVGMVSILDRHTPKIYRQNQDQAVRSDHSRAASARSASAAATSSWPSYTAATADAMRAHTYDRSRVTCSYPTTTLRHGPTAIQLTPRFRTGSVLDFRRRQPREMTASHTASTSIVGGKLSRTSCTPSRACLALSASAMTPCVEVAGTVQ